MPWGWEEARDHITPKTGKAISILFCKASACGNGSSSVVGSVNRCDETRLFIEVQISAEGNGVCFREGVRLRGRVEVT